MGRGLCPLHPRSSRKNAGLPRYPTGPAAPFPLITLFPGAHALEGASRQ